MAIVKNLMVRAGGDFSELQKELQKAQAKIKTAADKLKSFGKTVAKPVIAVKDGASSVISRVRKNLFSLQGLAVITLSVIGADKLKDATLGAAMDFESQQVAMLHWLKGNKESAKEATAWLENFATATPFEMSDLFPALSRGIGVTDGDVKQAERLVTLAGDMAALNPGKTVSEAMEALADAKIGEMARLTEFQMKFSKDDMDAMGFDGFLKEAEKKYANGAAELSKTSRGLFSTITDTINTFFRRTGQGILTSLMPRLQKITDWFAKNPQVVAKWQNQLQYWGKMAAERLLNAFERAFKYIKSHWLDNPEFKMLDFWGKVNFIVEDIAQLYTKWLNSGGAAKIEDFGEKVGGFIAKGIKKAAPEIGAALVSVMSETGKALGNYLLSASFEDWVVDIIRRRNGGNNGPGQYGGRTEGNNYDLIIPDGYDPLTMGIAAEHRSHLANGTDFWKGGITWVGEQGPELVNLPRGAQVLSNSKSMAAMSQPIQGDYTVTHLFQTNDKQIVTKIAQQFERDMKRQPTRMATLPSMA